MDISTRKPLITIITVCFNESPARIARTFESISTQTYDQIEWIVIDGGSNLETLTAIHKYISEIDMLVSEKDNGVYDAMNKGVEYAKGDWVNFMNIGDSYAEGDTVEKVACVIMGNPTHDCFYGDVMEVDLDNTEKDIVRFSNIYNKRDLHDRYICHQSLFARRCLFTMVGGFDVSYKIVADREWMVRTILAGAKALHTGMVVCKFNCNLSSNYDLCCSEKSVMQRRYYSWSEHIWLTIRWSIIKILLRLRTRNFKLPISWLKIIK